MKKKTATEELEAPMKAACLGIDSIKFDELAYIVRHRTRRACNALNYNGGEWSPLNHAILSEVLARVANLLDDPRLYEIYAIYENDLDDDSP